MIVEFSIVWQYLRDNLLLFIFLGLVLLAGIVTIIYALISQYVLKPKRDKRKADGLPALTFKDYWKSICKFFKSWKGIVALCLVAVLIATPIITTTVAGNINGQKVEFLSISKAPTKIIYEEGELFDSTGMEVEATLKNGKKEKVTDYEIDKTDSLTLTDSLITVTYKEKTAMQRISVLAPKPLFDVLLTEVKEYRVEAENLEVDDGWIAQPGREGMFKETPSNADETSNGLCVGSIGVGSIINIKFKLEETAKINIKSVMAKYEDTYDLDASIDFYIDDNPIAVPDVTFGHTETVLYTDWRDVDFGDCVLQAGIHTLKLDVNGGSAPNIDYFGFTVKEFNPSTELELVNVVMKTAPTRKIYAVGETFDSTGMVVEAYYNDFSKVDVTNEVVVSKTDALATTDTEVKITYKGYELSQTIRVIEASGKIATPNNEANKLFYYNTVNTYVEIDRQGTTMYTEATDYVIVYIYGSSSATEPIGKFKLTWDFTKGSVMNSGVISSMDGTKSIVLNGGPNNFFTGNGSVAKQQIDDLIAYAVGESYSATADYYFAFQSIAYAGVNGISDSDISSISTVAWGK